MRVVFTPEAARQADECDRWWRKNRPTSAGLFARELAEAKALIADVPSVGTIYATLEGKALLRLMLKKTKNHVYYVVATEKDRIIVHAVWGAPKRRGPKL